MSRHNLFLVLACSFSIAGPSFAAERHLGAHVHGQATVDVAIDGDHLQVGLHVPGHDAVGFEHPPTSDAEKRTLAHAIATLKAAHWLEPAKRAGCRLLGANVSAPALQGVPTGGHANVDATYDFSCADMTKLDALDIRLVEAFPSVQRIVVDVVSSSGGGEQVLERGVVRVDIKP
ncbi:MAG: hypothetical protein GAK28_03015 [Luteibacter sp.]|uniref:ZrgA family zinc uptake protein n=1 Tax=Luteibacter sp. TaxID=1886636 RepID=UPI001383A758|nr:DUF2796 domain-containing protein [Luteibacter sp.]KAF1005794.1 MAG: hypothetical protein GAK28_03015 [Luteibacter sp.]